MKDIKSLLLDLDSKGVRLSLDDGSLKSQSLTNALTREVVQLIKSNKDDIVQYLSARQQGSDKRIVPVASQPGQWLSTSLAQQRLWFIDAIQGNSAEYNMQLALEWRGEMNFPLLEKVFQALLTRHEILRTIYIEEDGVVLQKALQPEEVYFRICVLDLSQSQGNQQQEVQGVIDEDALYPFNLSEDLMLRVTLVKLQERQHVLILNMHHISADGWSMERLRREFFALYMAGADSTTLPELSLKYSDYARWQKQFIASGGIQKQLDYWKDKLDGIPVVHQLPLDYSRPKLKQHKAGLQTTTLSAQQATSLMAVARRYQLTPFMLLHALLSQVLARHSGQSDIVVGTPVANRMKSELDPVIGLFMNTLVLRVDTECAELKEYFGHVKSVHLDAQANQELPFDTLVEALNHERSLQHSPVFQILVTMQGDYSASETNQEQPLDLGNAEVQQRFSQIKSVMFDLEIKLSITPQGTTIQWFYDESLFSAQSVASLAKSYEFLLCRMADGDIDTEVPVTKLPMYSDSELSSLLYADNQTAKEMQTPFALHRRFEQVAQLNPGHTAVRFKDQTVTYRELNSEANRLARYLQENYNVGKDAVVGVYMQRSVEMVLAIMAILKAGGAYLPLDPEQPDAMVGDVLQRSGAVACLYYPDRITEQCQVKMPFVDLGKQKSDFASFCDSNLPLIDDEELGCHLAYVIYTSGSTGKPKGVMVPHKSLANRIQWMHNQYGLDAQDKVLQKTPFAFDVSVWEFLWTLGYGATLVVAEPGMHREPETLCQMIKAEGVTKLHFVPSMLDIMLAEDSWRQCKSVQQVFCSGEALLPRHVQGFQKLLPSAELHNLYGPTEAAIDVTYWNCIGFNGGQVPIGKAIDNIQLLLLDKHLNLVPNGAVGELHIGGVGLARGYLGQPELTEKSFINNPYFELDNINSSARLYKTGDLARRLPDGNLLYLGRNDFQVKVRGFRIELAGIEERIQEVTGVHSSLVAVQLIAGQEQLVAYVKLGPELSESDFDRLKESLTLHLQATLPTYQVPVAWQKIDIWPLTKNGKVNRKALPVVNAETQKLPYHAPVSETESILAEIWSNLMSYPEDEISRHANYFDLGGQSLLSMRLVSMVKKQIGPAISLQDVFNNPVLSQLASLIDSLSADNHVSTIPELDESGRPQATTTLQAHIFRRDQQQGASPELNRPMAYTLRGKIDLPTMMKVFSGMLQRHQLLRSVYSQSNGRVMQQVKELECLPFAISTYVVTDDTEKALDMILVELATKPFDLQNELPIKVYYVQCSDDFGVLLINTHQIVWDGWSSGVFIKELFMRCSAEFSQRELKLRPLPMQFSQYAAWQNQRIESGEFDNDIKFWQENLHNCDATHGIPLDFQRPKQKNYIGASLIEYLPLNTGQDLIAIARHANLSPFMLYHTALIILINKESMRDDIIVGTPAANRTREDVESLIGFISNFISLRTRKADGFLSELFAHVRQVHFDAQAHQEVPFELLLDRVNCQKVQGATPIFQVMLSSKSKFNLNSMGPEPEYSVPAVELIPKELDIVNVMFDLQLDIHFDEMGLRLKWVYDKKLFKKETIERLHERLKSILNAISNSSGSDILVSNIKRICH